MSVSIKSFLDVLVSLSIIGGLGAYFITDRNAKHLARTQQSLEFAKMLQSTEARAASFALFKPWGDIDLAALNSEGPNAAVVKKLVRDVVTSTNGLEEKIYETAGFYDTLSLCIDTGACDEATARGLMAEGAFDFFCLYKPVIEEMRSGGRPTLGRGLEKFALKSRKCGVKAEPKSTTATKSGATAG